MLKTPGLAIGKAQLQTIGPEHPSLVGLQTLAAPLAPPDLQGVSRSADRTHYLPIERVYTVETMENSGQI